MVDATYLDPYTSGIWTGGGCTTDVNHVMTLVGYGRDATTGLDYWLIK